MNPAYLIYTAIGNFVAWPFTVLFMLFNDLGRFLAFATAAIISGVIGTFVLTPDIILGVGQYAYIAAGAFFALVVFVNAFSSDKLPEAFNILYCLLTGVFVGMLIGYLV